MAISRNPFFSFFVFRPFAVSMIKSKRAFSFSVCASKSIQPFFLSASEKFVAIFIVGTGAPRGVPLPVVNKIKWQPEAVKLVTATISFPGPFSRLSPAFFGGIAVIKHGGNGCSTALLNATERLFFKRCYASLLISRGGIFADRLIMRNKIFLIIIY